VKTNTRPHRSGPLGRTNHPLVRPSAAPIRGGRVDRCQWPTEGKKAIPDQWIPPEHCRLPSLEELERLSRVRSLSPQQEILFDHAAHIEIVRRQNKGTAALSKCKTGELVANALWQQN